MADTREKPAKDSKGIGSRLKRAVSFEWWKDRKEAARLRATYTCFRILVIGRSNAGKTTLLKRVCNTTEEPSIFEEGSNLLEPTSSRGTHDVHRSFTFKSNPDFIFHDSPGFEFGGVKELEDVRAFIQERSKSNDVDEQIHAIWFCFEPDYSRPLLPLEEQFFNEGHAQNVPVIAVFTKFDDLIIQVLDRTKGKEENVARALTALDDRFKEPLSRFKFPPRAYVRFEALHIDEGNHQEQVGELIKATAASLDILALKTLFVSIQQNNINVSIQYAVNKDITSTPHINTVLMSTGICAIVGELLIWIRWIGLLAMQLGLDTAIDRYVIILNAQLVFPG